MTYRILLCAAVYDTRDTLAEAKSLALTEAALLADATCSRVTVKVYRMGVPSQDVFGRDTTPAYLVGMVHGSLRGVQWQEPTCERRAVA